MSRRPLPDDEKANSPILYVAFGLASVLLILAGLVLVFFPPAFAASIVIRGVRSGRPLLRAAGYALFALWFIAFSLLGRRLMAPPRPRDSSSQ